MTLQTPSSLPEAGWFPDPEKRYRLRYWDGTEWTQYVADSANQTRIDDIPLGEGRADLPFWVTFVAIGGFIGALILAGILVAIATAISDSLALELLLGQIGLYGGLLAIAVAVSRKWGRGDFRRDYGLEVQRRDWARVLGWGFLGRVAAGIVSVILVAIMQSEGESIEGQYERFETDKLAFLVLAVSASLAAPFFEELFFRGVLLRSLASRLGTVIAVIVAAVLFGAIHLQADVQAETNVIVFFATAVAGAIFGFAQERHRRTSVAMGAHAVFNIVAVIALSFQVY